MGAVLLFSSCGRSDVLSLENGRMSIAFDAATGWPVSMTDKAFNEEMLDDARGAVARGAAHHVTEVAG